VIRNPGPHRAVVSQHPQSPPIRQFLLEHFRRGLRLKPQGVAAKVQNLSACGIVGVMKLRGEAGEGIRRVVSRCGRELKISPAQAGACMTVPQTLQVRCWRLE
jgi:hypothetical protein